jgi:hypothetical protein
MLALEVARKGKNNNDNEITEMGERNKNKTVRPVRE